MAYTINTTNGNVLVTLQDGEINTSVCDLSLIGRNVSIYGERVNENLVKLLENFSNTTEPTQPLQGQLWFNNSSNSKQLHVYNGNSWVGLSSYTKSNIAPNISSGDLWYDTTKGQIFVNQNSTFRLVGPLAPIGYGNTQVVAEKIMSITPTVAEHEVLSVYVEGVRMALFSEDAEYTTDANVHPGFSIVKPGLNISSTASNSAAVINGLSTNSAALGGLAANQFMRSDQNTQTTGNLTVGATDGRLIVGNGSQTQVLNSNVTIPGIGVIGDEFGNSSLSIIRNTITNSGISLRARYASQDKDYLVVDTVGNRVIIDSDLLVTGNINASTANGLASPVSITLSGNVTGSVNFDGTSNVIIATTLDSERLKLSGGTMTGQLNADRGFVAGSASTNNLIYATTTKVGILNTDPQVALDVNGAIRTVPVVNSSSNGSIALSGLTTNHQINLNGAATISFSNFSQPGQVIRLVLVGTENPVSWDPSVYWPNGVAPNLANGPRKIAVITLMRPNTIIPSLSRPDANFILATYVSY